MKNRIKQYLLAASMCVGLTACSDFFEPIPGVQFGLDETFASKQRTEEYLNNVYSYVREVTDAIHPNTYGGIFTEASLDGANRWNKTYAEWTNGCTSIGQVRFSTEIQIRRQSRIKTANNFSPRPKITPNGLRRAMRMNGL